MSILSRLFGYPKPEPRRVPGAFVAAALAAKLHRRSVLIYDPTARKAVAVTSLREVDYTMT